MSKTWLSGVMLEKNKPKRKNNSGIARPRLSHLELDLIIRAIDFHRGSFRHEEIKSPYTRKLLLIRRKLGRNMDRVE